MMTRPFVAASIIASCLFTAGACSVSQRGILVMAHGGEPAWNQAVESAVAPLRGSIPVEIAYGMARSDTMQQAVDKLRKKGVREIAVVRLFVSSDSFLDRTRRILSLATDHPNAETHVAAAFAPPAHHDENHHTGPRASEAPPSPHDGHPSAHGDHTPHQGHAGHHTMPPPDPIRLDARVVLSRTGISESPLIDAILVDRVRALSTDPPNESVLLIAHGPADDDENQRWLANMNTRAAAIRSAGPFASLRCETLREDWPDRRAQAERRIRSYVATEAGKGRRVLVIPFRIAGFGPYAHLLEGLDYVADGRGFCPHPNVTRWIKETADACFARLDASAE